MTVQQLDINFLRGLDYREANLRNVEVEVTSDGEDGCGIALKDGKDTFQFTEQSLKHLCKYIDLPYAFSKTLRSKGRAHVISYLQKQLAQTVSGEVTLVCGNGSEEGVKVIHSVTDAEKLHYRGLEAEKLDTRLMESLSRPDSPLELSSRMFSMDGSIRYGLLFKEPKKVDEDKGDADKEKDLAGLWKFGFTLKHSVTGLSEPSISMELLRLICANMSYMPEKHYTHALGQNPEFEGRWADIEKFLQDPPTVNVSDLIARATKTFASMAELRDARNRLMRLKVDAEDTETAERINQALQWKRIQKAYAIRDMDDKPSPGWYKRATTPIKLFTLQCFLTQEATHAPNTTPWDVRQGLLIHGGKLLCGKPDLIDIPPVVDWSIN